MNTNQKVYREIKSVICVISLLQSREKAFRNELNFFNRRWQEVSKEVNTMKLKLFVTALKRLEHEMMFLCIETYSLHQGIEKKKSLYKKVIQQHGEILSKVDKTPINRDNIEFIGIVESDGKQRDATNDEEDEFYELFNEKAIKSREELRNNYGISSKKHEDIEEWLEQLPNKDVIDQLEIYRDDFAHRLDSLDKLKRELEPPNPQQIEKMINTVSTVLEIYKNCLQKIIVYTTSEPFLGRKLIYDSLSRLKEREHWKKRSLTDTEDNP